MAQGVSIIIVCHCVKVYFVGLLYSNTCIYLAINHLSQSTIALIDLAFIVCISNQILKFTLILIQINKC